MSAFCALCRPDGAPVAPSEIASMLDALDHWRADARDAWIGPGVGLGHLLLSTTHDVADRLPACESERDLAVTGELRLDNRTELAGALGVGVEDLASLSDGRLVLRAYARWGEHCCAHLAGDFAFVVWDGARRQMFCARDVFGVKPFYYTHGRGGFACASEIKGLLALPFVDRDVNERWIGDYLHRLALDRTDSFYRAVSRLEPAHAMVVTSEGKRTWRYWRLDDQPPVVFPRDEDYVEAFREALVRAVQRRVRTPFAVGAELSGGLDSSGVCAVAHCLLAGEGRELQTFSQVRPDAPDDQGELPSDERAAIDALCRHAGIRQTCFLTGEGGIMPALEWAHRHCDEPPRNLVSMYNDTLYEAAADRGVRVLLSGFGGNQGVTDVGAGRLRELLYHGPWSELWQELQASRRPGRAAARLLLGELTPSDDWVYHWFLRRSVTRQKFAHRPSRTDFARRLGLLARTRTVTRRHAQHARATLRDRTASLLDAPDVAFRLENAALAAASRRIEYRYPLLDAGLVRVYHSAPSRLKWRRGVGRYLFRVALADWLPAAIAWQEGRGGSANPGTPRRRRRDRAELHARLNAIPGDSPLFQYADPAKLAVERIDVGRLRSRRWHRETELIMLLLLERKLRDAHGGPRLMNPR